MAVEIAAAVLAASTAADQFNKLVQTVSHVLWMLFVIVSIFHLVTTPNVIDAITNKIVGYPTCTATFGAASFCFAPSQSEFTNILTPLATSVIRLTQLDLNAFGTLLSFGTLIAIGIIIKFIVLLNASFYIFTFLYTWFRFAGSLIPSS